MQNRGWSKNELFLRVDNFTMVKERQECNVLKVCEFCLETEKILAVSGFKCSLPSYHESSLHVKLC